MSWINDQIETRLRTVRQDARMRPIIDQVKATGRAGCSADDVLAVAARAAYDSFVRAGERPSVERLRERAFLAAAAASAEQGIVLCDIPPGADKTQHFFVSGMISLKVAEIADKVLPRRAAERLGIGASVLVGWFKELHDQLFASGYNREDLQADVAGAKKPFSLPVPQGAK